MPRGDFQSSRHDLAEWLETKTLSARWRYPRSIAMVEPRESPTGPITPELALVDPDLAARAREALPEHPWPAPVRIEPSSPPPRRGIPVVAAFSILSFLALLATLIVSLLPARDQPTFAADGQSIPPAVSSPRAKAGEPPVPAGTRTERTEAGTAGKPKPAAKPAATTPGVRRREQPREARRARNGGTATARKRREPPRFEPARAFGWVAQARAVYYEVTFLRNGQRFYRTRAPRPRLTLPRRIRFRPGVYRWTVRAAIRRGGSTQLGNPIVDSTFRVGD
jgi:hypothetical protein